MEEGTDLIDDETPGEWGGVEEGALAFPLPGTPPPAPRRPPVSVAETLDKLAATPCLQGVKLAALHGRLPAEVKDRTMAAFAAGQIDVLVATTVIEVGIDIPAATALVVLDADRFGLSQLHQLRGRVGRGEAAGVCLLVSEAAAGSVAASRLEAMVATTDGFQLAEVDLENRHEGDILGAAQSGNRSALRLLRVVKDAGLIGEARVAAEALVAEDPTLAGYPALAAAVERVVGEREDFLERG
ncbi:MAG: hypothetical protein LBR27_10335 [Bifidobacteriaceae bacterium]|nr:hypothetical protein [Bifidobacteriaceae bacterium]